MHSHAAISLRARSSRSSRSNRSNCSNAPALFELLEHRTLPAGNVSVSVKDTDFGRSIVIAGTSGDDAITVTQDSNGAITRVQVGGKSVRVGEGVID